MMHFITACEGAFLCICHMGVGGYGINEAEEEIGIPWELPGHGQIAKGRVTICQEFWRTFVHNSVAME